MKNKLIIFVLISLTTISCTPDIAKNNNAVYIFNSELNTDYKDMKIAFEKKRTAIKFESRFIANNCIEYLSEIKKSAPKIHKISASVFFAAKFQPKEGPLLSGLLMKTFAPFDFAISTVLSVEPSSTTIISLSLYEFELIESISSPINSSSFKVGIITQTFILNQKEIVFCSLTDL